MARAKAKPKTAMESWEEEGIKLMTTLRKFVLAQSMHGLKWRLKMVQHYLKKLSDHLDNEPKTTKKG